MRNIQFIKNYATRLAGDVWEKCEGQLASELVAMKVAVYIDEGELTAFKLNAPLESVAKFIVTQDHLDQDATLVEQGVKVGDEIRVTHTVFPSVPNPELEAFEASNSENENTNSEQSTKVKEDSEESDNTKVKDEKPAAVPKQENTKPAATPKPAAKKPAAK